MYHTPPKRFTYCSVICYFKSSQPHFLGGQGILVLYIFIYICIDIYVCTYRFIYIQRERFQDTCYNQMCCRCTMSRGCAACRGGVSWKNTTNPVVINHLPQFAPSCRIRIGEYQHQQNLVAFPGVSVARFPLARFSECRNNLREDCVQFFFLLLDWSPCAFRLMSHPFSRLTSGAMQLSLRETNQSMSQSVVPLIQSFSVSVLSNKTTLTSTLQTVYQNLKKLCVLYISFQ